MNTKKWAEMTDHDIAVLKHKQCSKCKYFSRLSEGSANSTCDYISIVGHSRGCSPLECKERGIYKPKEKKRAVEYA